MAYKLPAAAQRLVDLRAAKCVTLRDAATCMGMSYSALSMLEHGRQPTPDQAHRLAQFFGVPVSEFWSPPVIPGAAALSKLANQVQAAVRRRDDRARTMAEAEKQ